MTVNRKMCRHTKSSLVFSMAYAVALIGFTFVVKSLSNPSNFLVVSLALIPGTLLLGMLWSFWRISVTVDEAQRHFLTQSMIVSLFFTLGLSGVWGSIELMTTDLPRLPVFWIFPIFFGVFGLAACFGPGRGMGLK